MIGDGTTIKFFKYSATTLMANEAVLGDVISFNGMKLSREAVSMQKLEDTGPIEYLTGTALEGGDITVKAEFAPGAVWEDIFPSTQVNDKNNRHLVEINWGGVLDEGEPVKPWYFFAACKGYNVGTVELNKRIEVDITFTLNSVISTSAELLEWEDEE